MIALHFLPRCGGAFFGRLIEVSHQRPSAVPWPPILLVLCVLAAAGLNKVYPLAWPGLDDPPARYVGYGFGVLGVMLLVWSITTLRAKGTTVLPHWPATRLVTDGPYRWQRNPIYLADVFILFGLAELSKNIWFVGGGLAFAAAVTWLQILPEEKHLEAKFGDIYRDYKTRTRRWI